ncbi:MAG: hypothetical protein IJV90_00295 [Candidatus Methanomethylophilaceae archaeon]|nr:hypothetical protein [Candidatus Methanomethylophilaceae archaeon]
MDVTKLVYAIIGITVGVIVVATVLLPEIAEVTKEGAPAADYATLLGVVATLTIVAIVMIAVRLMGGSKN